MIHSLDWQLPCVCNVMKECRNMFSHDTNCFCIFSVVQCLVLWGRSQTSALVGNKKTHKHIVHLHERGRHSWKVNHAETLNTCTRTLNLKTSMSSRSGCVCNPRCSWDSTSRWTPRTLPLMARASSEAWATSSVKKILGPPVWVLFGINSPIISRGLSPAQHYSLSVLINTILEFKARKEASSWGWWQAEHWETIGPVSAPSCVA